MFCVKMGLLMENYHETDPTKTIHEFSENNFKSEFTFKKPAQKMVKIKNDIFIFKLLDEFKVFQEIKMVSS